MVKRLLTHAEFRRIARPRPDARILQRPPVREAHLPRQRPKLVDRVQMLCGAHVTLPARKKHNPWHRRWHRALQAANRRLRHGRNIRLLRTINARNNHVRLEQHSLERNPLRVQRVKNNVQRPLRNCFATFNRMIPVHQHFRFHNRHNPCLLAQSGIASQTLCIRNQATV